MQQVKLKIISKEWLTQDIMRMKLTGDSSAVNSVLPGQFVNIAFPELYLRRPISVCETDDNVLTIVFKVVGAGTALLADMKEGREVDVLMPLGNGFDMSVAGEHPVLIGGGVGVPPLLQLAKCLVAKCSSVDVVLGFNSRKDIILVNEFQQLGCSVRISTVDGSEGDKGFVTDSLQVLNADDRCTYYYACGPRPMLDAVRKQLALPGEISMEERMGCGFGACMGCTCHTVDGPKQVCIDGPVFKSDQFSGNDKEKTVESPNRR